MTPARSRQHALVVPAARRLAVGWLVVGALTGCGADHSAVNDELRRRNDELQREIIKVNAQLKLREQELSTLRGGGSQSVADADIPVLTKLELGRYSGGFDADKDDVDDALRVYLSTYDQRNRFLVVAGEAIVQAVLIKPGAAPTTVVERRFTAKEFEAAYRSGFTGSHYTLEVPFTHKLTEEMQTLTVKVTVVDAATGRSLSLEKPLTFHPKP